jgi:hypothetical protein
MNLYRACALILNLSFLLGLFFTAPIKVSSHTQRRTANASVSNKDSDQSLTGKKAVEELKRSGGYLSLEEAFKKASGMSLSDPEPANLLPGGSYEEVGLTASDGAASNRLGSSVAISGDLSVVGAPREDSNRGAAYVFTRSGNTWSQRAKLTGSGRAANDYFGTSVSISGGSIAVGAPGFGTAGSIPGATHVFVGSGSSWTEQAKITASDGEFKDQFGYSVSLSGDTLLVGAITDQILANQQQGSAYVFTRSGSNWTQQGGKLTASDGAQWDLFGVSVSLDGDTAIVGSFGDELPGAFDGGAAYIFTRSGTTWTEQQKLSPPTAVNNANFGNQVAISGETVAVASYRNTGTVAGQGLVYVYTRSGSTWSLQQTLAASDGATGDNFGYSVSLSGDLLAVGANNDDSGAISNHGSAHLFKRSGSTWTFSSKFVASDSGAADELGSSVAVDGDTVIAGVPLDNVGANSDQGSAKIFQTKMTISKVIASDGEASDEFGRSVAISGDIVVVGAYLDDIGMNLDQGSAYIFKRSGATWVQEARLVATDGAQSDTFGYSVAVSGDNVVVSSPFADIGPNNDQGAVYLFTKSSGSWVQNTKLTASDGAANDYLGYGYTWSALSISGDDVIVGAAHADIGPNSNQGAAYIFTKLSGSWVQNAKLIASDGAADDLFGTSVAISGNHAVAGAMFDDIGMNDGQGSAYVFRRSGGTWAVEAKLVAPDGAQYDNFGYSVAISGDTVVAGAPLQNIGGIPAQGSAYVFTRSGTSWPQQAKLVAPDGGQYDYFGYSVAISTDTVVVGALVDDIGSNFNQGSAHVFARYGTSWWRERQLIASDGAVDDMFGHSVAVSGETAVVGAPFDNIGSNGDQGSAYIYHWGTSTPTSAGASLSGRVLETNGRGLANATVVLTDSTGFERTVQTGSFGRFSFSDLPSGETYIVSVRSRRFVFSPQVVNLQSDLSDVRLEASGRSGR